MAPRGRGRGEFKAKQEKVKSLEIREPTYDSDSYENHVIDLRGDEYQSTRQKESDAGSSDFEDRSSVKEEAQSQSEGSSKEYPEFQNESSSKGDAQSENEGSIGNSVGPEVDVGGSDSVTVTNHNEETESEETHSVEFLGGAILNALAPQDPQISDVGFGADGGADEGTSMAVTEASPRFKHGQLVWAKFARFPWWPAEIINERAFQPGTGGNRRSNTDVLVRFFGTYDYGWVDPEVGLSEFDVKMQERSRIKKKAFQKGIEEALEYRRSGKLPDSFTVSTEQEEPKTPKKPHSNGVRANGMGQQTPEDEGTEQRRAARKRKPKVLYEEEERVQRKPERRLRRLRIMRQLGLAAPTGSPFILDTRMLV
ncbi:uncharacterized protein [Physcomitrium patens]|uniref:uncharacterized protein n=1 Tax=Physcomitrium patens TaxID=3218 RepID=UPI00016212AB|nr:PWWP domain-containing protein2-like [Physcomitrium patens]XP_024382352.1 PWWP domain-containing protein2-like [Physcomitrium patens]XP_024382360.1 PWWP domain-containing protein2-like [Physcomitrium patens]XP_024382369.1 PWWP domain-containing protein2-like [Physcomitrium patens]XP_024382378.1 PWWP domain-containing protein2-like [Physcomitrium patens]XP_024382384.1 PWWP domain-containing protein2-like [Physcomitrium patens]|eukprot:XP_024382345.1 PWWP domain-containing protein2-like [Physcomitrella patens]